MRSSSLACFFAALMVGFDGPSSLDAQDANTLTPQAVLQQARQSYETRRQQLSVAKAYAVNWFPYSTSFKNNAKPGTPHFTPVPGGSGMTGGRLSLAGKAQSGDVLRISVNGGKKYALLVYAGERSFVGEQRSMFYYPFRTRLEFNVFPPRRHREHIEARYKKLAKTKGKLSMLGSAFYQYTSDGWLTGHTTKSRKLPLYWKVSALQNMPYQLFRPVQRSRFEKLWAAYGKSLWATASYNEHSIVPNKPHLKNRCAIRLSHSLGFKIDRPDDATYVSKTGVVAGPNEGGTGWYIRSLDLSKRFRRQYGQPVTYTSGAAAKAAMKSKKGLAYWHRAYSDANHIDFWNGSEIGTNVFASSGIGDPFTHAQRVEFWEIKD